MFVKKNFLIIVILLSVIFAVAMKATVFQKEPTPPPAPVPAESAGFRAYWHAGQAELTSYTLHQVCNGDTNQGQATLIFGTEDFRTDRQVKSASAASHDNSTPVLKTSFIRKFIAGTDDCSSLTTVFTPVNAIIFPTTLKVSHSTQAWAGVTYMQANFRNNGYQVVSHSYVDDEADDDYRVDRVLLEDELYNRIRLNPAKLPTGSVPVIPSAASARLRHKKLEPQVATITRQSVKADKWFGASVKPVTTDSVQAYTLDYTKDARTLTIVFEKAFPHRIMGWEETYKDAGKMMTFKATLVKTIRSDYGKHHARPDFSLLP